MTSALTDAQRTSPHDRTPGRPAPRRTPKWGTQLFLSVMAVIWLIPLLWSVFTALRPKASTDEYGYSASAAASISRISSTPGAKAAY